MKKIIKGAAIALVCASLAILAGCSLFGYRADENYPYDIAVQNGYRGTEGEWLSGQETPGTIYRRMYDEAVEDGSFTGTYFEFLQELDLASDATPYIQRALLSVVSITARFPSSAETVTSSGAGVLYKLDKGAGDAYILTNYHVLYSSTKQALSKDISVYLYGSELTASAIPATYYGGSMDYDLALLRVQNSETLKGSDAREVTLAAGHSVAAGERVYAIGNPLNRDLSVTSGVVSVEEEWVTLTAADGTGRIYLPEIRVDAAINHGNSGGGLFNGLGELVGVVNARDGREDVQGFGYAIPLELAEAFAENTLRNSGAVRVLRDGLQVVEEDSRGVYDEGAGRVHISRKLVVSDYNAGAGASAQVRQGDTLISGYVMREGEKLAETQFTHLCAWEAFRFKVQTGDTLYLTVSRVGEEKVLRLLLNQPTFFSAL